ncbi:aquaporin [Streptomyces sp. TE4109]
MGLATALIIALLGPRSGGSANPARQLGPALMSGNTTHLWIYLLAPVTRRARRRRHLAHARRAHPPGGVSAMPFAPLPTHTPTAQPQPRAAMHGVAVSGRCDRQADHAWPGPSGSSVRRAGWGCRQRLRSGEMGSPRTAVPMSSPVRAGTCRPVSLREGLPGRAEAGVVDGHGGASVT